MRNGCQISDFPEGQAYGAGRFQLKTAFCLLPSALCHPDLSGHRPQIWSHWALVIRHLFVIRHSSFVIALAVIWYLLSGICIYAESKMIEIVVEIEEVSEKDYYDLGIKWNQGFTLMEGGSLTGEVAQQQAGTIFEKAPLAPDGIPALFTLGEINRLVALKADLKALEQQGKAHCIAKPKLVTRADSPAKFLAGGEIPVVATGISGGYIEWKEYGIKLEIKPTLTKNNLIDTFVKTEVSALDWTNAVQQIPGITTRSTEAQVRVKSGETILLSGLYQTRKQTTKTGIPLLCKIPYLGVLFSNQTIRDEKFTLMVFVTPRIVERR